MNLLSVSQRKNNTLFIVKACWEHCRWFISYCGTYRYLLSCHGKHISFILQYSSVDKTGTVRFFFFDLIEKGHCLFLKHSSSLCRDPWCKSKPSQGQADPRETVPASTDSKQMVFALFHSFWKQELLHILLIIYYFYLQKCVHSYTCCGFNLASEICKM